MGANGGYNGMDCFELEDTLDLNSLNNIASLNDLIQGYNNNKPPGPGNGKCFITMGGNWFLIMSFYRFYEERELLETIWDYGKRNETSTLFLRPGNKQKIIL